MIQSRNGTRPVGIGMLWDTPPNLNGVSLMGMSTILPGKYFDFDKESWPGMF
jgi:hypothetical protein